MTDKMLHFGLWSFLWTHSVVMKIGFGVLVGAFCFFLQLYVLQLYLFLDTQITRSHLTGFRRDS